MVTTEVDVDISELVQKMAFIPFSPLIRTSWTAARVGQNGLVGVITAVEMLIVK